MKKSYLCVRCGSPAGIMPYDPELKCLSCPSKTIIWGTQNDLTMAQLDISQDPNRWRAGRGEHQA
ncbi:MAG: hypothetical protein HY553_10900 [Elusimicrobia bacterium]|nr:hypothetical protein [Elusimicrobiota bacterium]